MKINVIVADIIKSKSDVIVFPHFEGQNTLQGMIAILDKALNGVVTDLIQKGEIKGKFKEITQIYTLGKIQSPKVVILGFGKEEEINTEKIRVSVAEICKSFRKSKSYYVDFVTFEIESKKIKDIEISQSIVEGALLGTYEFNKHKIQDSQNQNGKGIGTFNLAVNNEEKVSSYQQGCRKGSIVAEASIITRDMVNEPANFMTPSKMAEISSLIAKKHNLKIDILGYDEIQKMQMGGLLGVAQGSREQPKFIIIEYQGNCSSDIDVALVGKGITFDSGGISIKPSENMGDMKGDMAGGASVISVMGAIAQFKPQINVLGIIPATENMPSGSAMRPGDIIKIMNGKTVEIISTDAEGRLILADGICYAKQRGAKRIIDIATLTGGCRIALGDICTGAFSNNQELVNSLMLAASAAGECVWQLPMNEEYRELNKSEIADLKNSGGRYGSAISAAWFLGEFAEEASWVHLDIAGTAMSEKERGYVVKGATGIPVRTIINYLLSIHKQ